MTRKRMADSVSERLEVGSSRMSRRGFLNQTFTNLDELLLGHRQGLHDRIGIMVKPQPLKDRQCRGPEFLPVQENARASRFQAKKNILGDRKIGGQVQFLVNNCDTFRLRFRGIREFDSLSVELNRSCIRLVNPSDDLHQGAFSSTIFTHHRVDAPGPELRM